MRDSIAVVVTVALVAGSAAPAWPQTPPDGVPSASPTATAMPTAPEPSPTATPNTLPPWLHGGPLPLPGATLGERPAESDEYQSGWAAGRTQARRDKAYDWAAIGFGGGLLCSAVGCAGATAAGALVKPDDWRTGLESATPEYLRGSDTGYRRELRLRRAKAAFLTGSVATVIGFVAFVAYANAHPCTGNCSSGHDWHH